MGDADDAIQEGWVCQDCSEVLDDGGDHGYPRSCADCLARQQPIPPPEGWAYADQPHHTWRAGKIFRRGYNSASGREDDCWYDAQRYISIRPDETGAEAYKRECGEPLPKATYVCWRDM